MWDPQPPSKHASPLPPQPPSNLHRPHVITDTPAKRITFYKSGDSQFGGVRMAVHKRSFKCFDALLDDLSQKVPLPFGVRTVTTPQGTHTIKHLEQLQDGGCYLCSDRRQAKPINMELARKHPGVWYNDNRRPHRPETSSSTHTGHMPYKQRRILLVKNSEPGIRRSIVLSRRSTRSLRSFLEEVSEVMQFHVRKLYTAEGRRIESVQSLMTCSGVLVCVGREAFSPMLVNFIRKSSEERLPGLNSRSPGLGPRTPGNGARSPGTQGVRSPPHGAQSRASEYSEVYESRKNVNFGLETKKSIIHPRSDSSNRSARFSLSSEKSYGNGVSAYSQAKPAIMNEDIEKRVLVNKDGSLSVEMRVRFRLRNDETLQWSTQIKKSPSLTNECCPLSQAQPHYLQQGQSESCSDPDSTAYDHEGVHCSRQTLQHAPHGNTCPCCCQRAEQQYDFWENPAHSCKPPPVPPPHTHSHTHTMMRHTHSSSSSSSCNSRRVVRCRARLSGTEQKQLMQEETCVTEQVERRVEVEQDGETHVEVCKVSRCSSRSEVVATDSNLQLHSRKSVEDDALMEVEGERPLSAVSSSSRVLQLLKEDQDEEVVENGSRGVSAASSCHCGEATVESKNEEEEMDQAPSVKHSSASCRSSKTKAQNSEDNGSADDEDEEIKRVVSSLSARTGGSLHSRASSVCPHCGGCKRGGDSVTPTPATPLSSQETANNGSENEGSDVSVVSTQSNKTNLTNNGRISADRASGCMSKMSNPEAAENEEQERAGSTASARSHRSCKSHKSSCKGSTGVPADSDRDKSPSAMSARSGKSHKSSCKAESPDIRTREEAEGENAVERAQSALSAKSGASSKTCASVKLSVKAASPTDDSAPEEDNTSNRSHSALSVKSNTDKVDRTGSALSAKSHVSAKSGTSHRSKCSHCARAVSPGDNPGIQVTGEDEGMEAEERAGSAISALSNLTAKSKKSHKSKASKRSISPRSEAGGDAEERSVSQMSGVSVKSNSPVKSSKQNDDADEVVAPAEEEEKEMEEEETEQRPESARSAKLEVDERSASAMSSKSHKSKCEGSEKGDDAGDGEKDEDRAASALSSKSASGKSHISAKSSKSQKSHKSTAAPNPDEDGDKSQERVASALSVKSKSSVRTSTSHKSSCSKNLKLQSPIQNVVTIQTPGGADEEGNETTERPLSAASAKSGKSNLSSASMHKSDIAVIETADEEKVATPSPEPPSSPKSTMQQLLPGPDVVEPRGQSALSVHSKTSTKSGRSKCRCGAASARDKADKEKDDEEMKSEGASEAAGSIRSSSTRRRGRESEGTGHPLSQNSGSVSLGLPEDQETADSDSGKSTVSFHITTERRSRRKTATPNGAKSTEQSTMKEFLLETGSIKSRKSNASSSKSHLSHKNPAGDIPTIEAPEGIDDQGETGSVRSVSTTKASNADAQSHRTSPAMSSASAKVRKKSPSSATAKRKAADDSEKSETENPADSRPASKMEGIEDIAEKAASVHSKSLCCLRPESAASAHSGSKMKASKESKGESSVQLASLDPLKSPKARSTGSSKRKTITKEAPVISSSPCPIHSSRPCSKEEAYSESTLSHSLSAADLLKETMAAARPHSRQSKTSDKPRSERSGKCHRSRNQRHQEETQELTPACLPNASPNEVVSEWLRSIPTDNTMLTLGDELNEDGDLLEKAVDEEPGEEISKEQESPEDEKVDQEENVEAKEEEEEEKEEDECDAAEEKGLEQPAGDAVVGSSQPNHQESSGESRNWNSSAAVMKVLLSSSLGRCRSMPEVSPVYGRRLSTSARGLLDCLAQLQLIEPAVCPERQKHHNQQYEDIMAILQSLWLAEPENIQGKDSNGDQISPPRSSSGVGMSSGSAGSGKENGNQGEDETNNTKTKGTESMHEEEEVDKVAEAENEDKEEVEAEPEELKIDIAEEAVDTEEQNTDLPSEDNPKAVETPSSSDKSSANGSSKSRTDNETQEDSSTGTPPTVLHAPLSKRPSQDPDPVWILHLLKKLEKQFMNHYITAMAEFKVRWDLDDSLILDTMISELKEEVSRRIQNSIEREMSKIQSRAGKGGRSPRPPLVGNLSRESTMTEKRRRMLKVMKNKSVKTADSLSDGENTADFSDQRSDDEYCPCDACVRKKMAARPLRMNPNAAEAPVMMEFDLLKILQLKKGPSPAPVVVPQAEVVEEEEEEENNLEVVEEEEEEGDESKEDIKADVVLEETIPEEDEEMGDEEEEEEEGLEAVEEEEAENEGHSGEQEDEEETSDNGDVEEEEEGECQCQCAVHEEEGEEEVEGEEAAAETEDAEETCDNTGEDEAADADEKTEDEEGETAGNEEETATGEEGETGTGEEEEEESDKETVKGEATGEGETTEGEEGETTGRESGEEGPSGETGDDSDVKEASNEESKQEEEEEEEEENGSASAEAGDEEDGDDGTGEGESHEDDKGGESGEQEVEASEEERTSPQGQGVTEGEEADAEDSEDTDAKRPSDTSVDESGQEGGGATGEEEVKEGGGGGDDVEEFKPDEDEEEVNRNKKEDSALLQQFTRTSVESQPGSLEDIGTDSPRIPVQSIEVPKMAPDVSAGGGSGNRRSRSPARVKRRKPKQSDVEMDDF